jgi:hypothetical protein
MKRKYSYLLIFCAVILCLTVTGCATTSPKGFLSPGSTQLENRQLQMRQYDSTDEKQIISAVAGVLQDLGFTLDDSETELGFIAASKAADATDSGQIAGAVLLDILAGIGGSYSNATSRCDKHQVVKSSVIARPSLEGDKMTVRVTFQRVVWNMSNQVSRVETIKDPEIYQKFYDSLSKAIFLEAHEI